MAELAITQADVRPGSGYTAGNETAGEAIQAGDYLYKKSTDSKIYRAQCDGTAEEADVIGAALHPTNANQPIVYQKVSGKVKTITIGGTLTVNTIYVLGNTPGKIKEYADLATGERIVIIGIASSAAVLDQSLFQNTGRTAA